MRAAAPVGVGLAGNMCQCHVLRTCPILLESAGDGASSTPSTETAGPRTRGGHVDSGEPYDAGALCDAESGLRRAQRLRVALDEDGLTVSGLQLLSNVGERTIRAHLGGTRSYQPHAIAKMADALGVDADWLSGRARAPHARVDRRGEFEGALRGLVHMLGQRFSDVRQGPYRLDDDWYVAVCSMVSAIAHVAEPETVLDLSRAGVSDFVRGWLTRPVREWVSPSGGPLPKRARCLVGSPALDLGPLVSVTSHDGCVCALTDDCFEALDSLEGHSLGDAYEGAVYRCLRSLAAAPGCEGGYARWREWLIRTRYLDAYEYQRLAVEHGRPVADLLQAALEPIPPGRRYYVCPRCGWTMSWSGDNPSCISPACRRYVREHPATPPVPLPEGRYRYRLRADVVRYISLPGRLELRLRDEALSAGRVSVEMWPPGREPYEQVDYPDRCDLAVTFADQARWDVDAKDYANAAYLVGSLRCDREFDADRCPDGRAPERAFYVVPDELWDRESGTLSKANEVGRHPAEFVSERRFVRLVRTREARADVRG